MTPVLSVFSVVLALVGGLTAPAYAERVDAGARDARPLAGRVVVLDPGHQLGNHNFPGRINRLVPDGRGGRKACNTTGTATAGGYAEATFNWEVARLLRSRLEHRGATVRMTRTTNSQGRWGPCVDVRGRAGNRPRADLKLSIHADGNLAGGARGFHVIVAPDAPAGSARFAGVVRSSLRRSGLPVANYIAGGDGLDVRTDLTTLNFARLPTAMVELGNMRDRVDAGRMTSARGRTAYADALARAVRHYLR
ncbi:MULTISPECIES: N-acetylmuramoyl-L-alanine amidase [unclassified Nocardioides]|uniref:N-acetylmuramoyl-L-alanine amidase n=1 Tax=unclassified Nocardioides TaxID=2615069 RepID=UPI00362169EE